jgi:formylglycine-generating enzyme required for sulfatase activity
LVAHLDPQSGFARLEEYREREGQLSADTIDEGTSSHFVRRELPAGSYRLVFTAPGRVTVRYPFVLGPRENLEVTLRLPAETEVPEGFVYVPAGRFLSGSSASEELRLGLSAAPIHQSSTSAFLIAQHEMTFSEWLALVDSLPVNERKELLPSVQTPAGSVRVEKRPQGWWLWLRPASLEYAAGPTQVITYPGREAKADHRWAMLPVSGISPAQVEALIHRAKGVERLRLCSETEWERAARGSDGRSFTTGERIRPDQGNFDRTYGRRSDAFGPDEVGSHPESNSPFGLADTEGNAFEMVRSTHDDAELLEKGSSWYQDTGFLARLEGRFALERGTRGANLGIRLCRDAGGYP